MVDDSIKPDSEEADYPGILRVEVGSTEDISADAIETAEAFEEGEIQSDATSPPSADPTA